MDSLQRFFLGRRLFQLFGPHSPPQDYSSQNPAATERRKLRAAMVSASAPQTPLGRALEIRQGPLEHQPAAYTLRSVAALILLRDHPVVGHFHRQPFQIGFQWLVRTGAHVSLIHFPSTPFYFVLPPHACFRVLPSPNTPKDEQKSPKTF